MALTPVTIHVAEVTGERTEPQGEETNLVLSFPESALTNFDVNAPFFVTPLPAEFGLSILSAGQTAESEEIDLQKTLDTPATGKLEAAVLKSQFPGLAEGQDVSCLSNGRSILVPVGE